MYIQDMHVPRDPPAPHAGLICSWKHRRSNQWNPQPCEGLEDIVGNRQEWDLKENTGQPVPFVKIMQLIERVYSTYKYLRLQNARRSQPSKLHTKVVVIKP